MKPRKRVNSNKSQSLNIKGLCIALVSLLSLFETKLVLAQNQSFSYSSIQNTEILYQAGENETEKSLSENSNLKNVEQALSEVLQNPLFQKLPPHYLMIDPVWTKSGGFFSPDLKNKNRPGVLLGLSNLATVTQAKRVIAHELTHLLFHESNPNEAPWVSEGAAMLVESLVTGAMSPSVRDAFLHPEVTLTGNFDPRIDTYQNESHQAAQYGNVQLYFSFLYRLCGQEAFLNQLFETNKTNLPLIDSILSESSCKVGKTFEESFKSFSIAKAMQDLTDPFKYVFFGALKMDVLDHPALLEPFSETVYRLNDGDRCKRGEIPWGLKRCIRIRAY